MPLRCINCGSTEHRHRDCPHPSWLGSREEELTKFFNSMLSKSSNELLTKDDVARQLKKYDYATSNAPAFFVECPHKSSKGITLQEFINFSISRESFLVRLFNEFDLSGSNSINRHEFKRALESVRLQPTEDQCRVLIAAIDQPSGPNGCVPPNGKIEFHEFRNFMLLANPTGRFVDFSLLADDWLEYASDIQPGSAIQTGSAQKKEGAGKKIVPAWTSAVSGAIGNSFSRTAIAPLERVRMSMITDPGKYRSFLACITEIYKNEGVKGLWRGNMINVYRIAPQGAIGFFCKDYFKQLLAGKGNDATPMQTLGASMASGIVQQTLVYPLDTIRTRMTTTKGYCKGLTDGWKRIVAEEGWRALFLGLGPANCFAVPYYGTQFFTYDMLRMGFSTYGMPEGEKRAIHPLIGLPFGAVSACTACAVAFPLQMAWKRIQVQGIGGRPVLYTGTVQCIKLVVKTEGVAGVYSGLQANIIKLMPTGALTFLGIECVKKVMDW